MLSLSPNKQNIVKGALLSALFLVLGAVLLTQVLTGNVRSQESVVVTQKAEKPMQKIYDLDGVLGISNVFDAVQKMSIPEEEKRGAPVSAAILPHHTLLGRQLAEFWFDIGQTTEPSVIVIVGPAHEDQGTGLIQTTRGTWQTPFGDVSTDEAYVTSLLQRGTATLEPDSFDLEHSIGVHMPYIARVFPGTPVVPVIANSHTRTNDAEELVFELKRILPEDALFISSIDFSHYLDAETTAQNDLATMEAIEERDYTAIDSYGPANVDSIFALSFHLLMSDAKECQNELVWHEYSGDVLEEALEEGTSYLVYVCTHEEPIIVTAVGDIMLGRGVGYWYGEKSPEDVYADAQEMFTGTDIGFGNLESVLTNVEPSTGKTLFFKGKPERVDVLDYIGFTHLSVSNNHVDDYGLAGWQDSKNNLEEAGYVAIGGYRNDGETEYSEVNGKTVAFLAFEDLIRRVDTETMEEQVREAKTKAEIVVISFHWGSEYTHSPSQRQKDLAHAAIDAGADIVIGHHPHVLQGIEIYDNSLILYSLGNFIFDQFGEDENESVIARIAWSEKTKTLEFIPMRIIGGFPHRANEVQTQETLNRLAEWSDEQWRDQISTGKIVW